MSPEGAGGRGRLWPTSAMWSAVLTSQVMMKMMKRTMGGVKRTMGGVAGQAKCRNLSFETSGNTDHCSYDSLGTGCLFQKGACSLSLSLSLSLCLSVSQRISML